MKKIVRKGDKNHAQDDARSELGVVNLEEIVEDLKKNPEFKNFSDEQLKTVAEAVSVEIRQEIFSSSFSGPLPPPAAYGHYEQILPGAADRILAMAEDNADDRSEINTKIVNSDIKRSGLGQILGFILSILFIGASIACAYLNQPFPASVLGIGGFSSIISIFVLGKK